MIHSNFTAELHCQHGRVGVAATGYYDSPFSPLSQGWLCPDEKQADTAYLTPVVFDFTFIEQRGDRIHYHINCSDTFDYAGARLAQDNSGWLCLYGMSVAGRIWNALNPANLFPQSQPEWKFELLQPWDGDIESIEEVEFYLRNRHGYRIALVDSHHVDTSAPRWALEKQPRTYEHWYLHAGTKDGEILRFCLRNVKPA
jgi:hypothetical protein